MMSFPELIKSGNDIIGLTDDKDLHDDTKNIKIKLLTLCRGVRKLRILNQISKFLNSSGKKII